MITQEELQEMAGSIHTTVEQIVALRDEAVDSGDDAMAYIANTALGRTEGHQLAAVAQCERAAAAAR